MGNSIWEPFKPKYIIGCDLSTHEADYSAATISTVVDGILMLIDKKISKDSNEVKKFVEKYESKFFTINYQNALLTGRIFQSQYLGEIPQEQIERKQRALEAMLAYKRNCIQKYDRPNLPSLPPKKGEYMSDFAARFRTTEKEMKECEQEAERIIKRDLKCGDIV